MTRSDLTVGLLLLVLTALAALGCENTITPYSERATYSIWGYLDLTRKQQFVRVKDLDKTLSSERSSLPDLTVTLTNLSTGTTEALKDSVVFFDDKEARVVTQNYWTDTTIEPDTRYRLAVEDDHGTTVRATTTTPPATFPTVSPDSGHCLNSFTVEFRDVEKEHLIEADAAFAHGGDLDELEFSLSGIVESADDSPRRDHAFVRFKPENILLRVYDRIDELGTPCTYESLCSKLQSVEKNITISYTYLGPGWFGSVPEDPLGFSPIRSSVIENGSGFFGAITKGTLSVTVDAGPVDITPCPAR